MAERKPIGAWGKKNAIPYEPFIAEVAREIPYLKKSKPALVELCAKKDALLKEKGKQLLDADKKYARRTAEANEIIDSKDKRIKELEAKGKSIDEAYARGHTDEWEMNKETISDLRAELKEANKFLKANDKIINEKEKENATLCEQLKATEEQGRKNLRDFEDALFELDTAKKRIRRLEGAMVAAGLFLLHKQYEDAKERLENALTERIKELEVSEKEWEDLGAKLGIMVCDVGIEYDKVKTKNAALRAALSARACRGSHAGLQHVAAQGAATSLRREAARRRSTTCSAKE